MGAKIKKKRNVTEFQRIIRERRLEITKSQAQVAVEIGVSSPEFISMVELGIRRVDLNRVPALARSLGLDPGSLCQQALWEEAPEMFRILFGEHYAPKVELAAPGQATTIHVLPEAADFWDRFSALPDDVRRAVDTIVKSLYSHALEKSRLPRFPAHETQD